jgi:Fe-S cluster assembly protein SufD
MLDWLTIARNQAEERYRSLPLPSAQDENFRFTNVDLAAEGLAAESARVPSELSALEEDEGALLTITGEEAELKGEVPSMLFTDLLRAAVLGSESMRTRLKDGNLFPQDKFAQLSSARWKNGVFMHVPAGVKLAKPLRAATVASEGENHFRHLVILEDGAEAVLIQESFSEAGERIASELTEVRLGRGAKLHWIVLQRYGEGTKAILRQRLDLAPDSELKITPLHVGGGLVQVRQEARLEEEASLELLGAARGDGIQHFDFWLDVEHAGSRSKSEMELGFVMGDSSRAVFNGLIRVNKGTEECNSSQKSKSLLLGNKATVHAIPKLIIQTDAVKCSHGASVSSVNPEQVHYLQSRGISRSEAESMIIRGFTEPVVDRLPTEGLQARAEAALDQKRGSWLQ